jgi:hypothetical protein
MKVPAQLVRMGDELITKYGSEQVTGIERDSWEIKITTRLETRIYARSDQITVRFLKETA